MNEPRLTADEINDLEEIGSQLRRQHVAEHGIRLGTYLDIFGEDATNARMATLYNGQQHIGRALLRKHVDLLAVEDTHQQS